MNYNEIIKLLEAGYTKEEIQEMNADGKPEETLPEDADEKSKESSPAVDELSKAVSEMKKTFEGIKNEIQALNIMNSQIANNEISGEDIIANIINPFENNNK